MSYTVKPAEGARDVRASVLPILQELASAPMMAKQKPAGDLLNAILGLVQSLENDKAKLERRVSDLEADIDAG